MDRKEMLRERQLLEDKIQDVVLKFEEKTGLTIGYVEVRHEQEGGGEFSIPWVSVDARLD